MNAKTTRYINIFFNIFPWTLILLRATFDWALQAPYAKNLIIGYIVVMIIGGIFSIVTKRFIQSLKTWDQLSILLNIFYLIAGIVLLFLIN